MERLIMNLVVFASVAGGIALSGCASSVKTPGESFADSVNKKISSIGGKNGKRNLASLHEAPENVFKIAEVISKEADAQIDRRCFSKDDNSYFVAFGDKWSESRHSCHGGNDHYGISITVGSDGKFVSAELVDA